MVPSPARPHAPSYTSAPVTAASSTPAEFVQRRSALALLDSDSTRPCTELEATRLLFEAAMHPNSRCMARHVATIAQRYRNGRATRLVA